MLGKSTSHIYPFIVDIGVDAGDQTMKLLYLQHPLSNNPVYVELHVELEVKP